jgi:hypothetical protein
MVIAERDQFVGIPSHQGIVESGGDVEPVLAFAVGLDLRRINVHLSTATVSTSLRGERTRRVTLADILRGEDDDRKTRPLKLSTCSRRRLPQQARQLGEVRRHPSPHLVLWCRLDSRLPAATKSAPWDSTSAGWEARHAEGAEKEAAARRATEAQIPEDAARLVAAWNERQAKRMPMLFSPTIGCALKARHWFLWVCCPACRTTQAVDLRTLDRHPWSALTSLIPALSYRSCRPHAPFAELVRLSKTSVADDIREDRARQSNGGWEPYTGDG